MKRLMCITFCFFSFTLVAQDWHEDFNVALATSKAENKPLILVFAGSDWCAPCIKLNRDIWSSDTFKAYAADNYVLYKADFPRKKKNHLSEFMINQNKELAEKYNPRGHFPLVVVLDGDETVKGKTGYNKVAPNEYIKMLNAFVK